MICNSPIDGRTGFALEGAALAKAIKAGAVGYCNGQLSENDAFCPQCGSRNPRFVKAQNSSIGGKAVKRDGKIPGWVIILAIVIALLGPLLKYANREMYKRRQIRERQMSEVLEQLHQKLEHNLGR